MLKIRLTRVGKKNSPSYRVVVADKKRAVKRKFIEIIGNYNPTLKPKQIVIDKDRALFWIGNGAQPSDTVNNLMVNLGILAQEKKINKVYGKKLSKKAIKEGPSQNTDNSKTGEETAPEDIEEAAPKAETVEETSETEAPIEEVPIEEIAETPAEESPAEKATEQKATEE